MKKKIIALILAAVTAISLMGCGNSKHCHIHALLLGTCLNSFLYIYPILMTDKR